MNKFTKRDYCKLIDDIADNAEFFHDDDKNFQKEDFKKELKILFNFTFGE